MSEQSKNPAEFGYLGTEVLNISSREFMNVAQVVDHFLEKETKKDTTYKFKYINSTNGAAIAKVTDKNRDVAVKVIDIQKTLESEPQLALTPDGIQLLRVKMILEGIHLKSIEAGVAKHYLELQAMVNTKTPVAEPEVSSEAVDVPEENTPETEGEAPMSVV